MKKPHIQILYNSVQHIGKNMERVYLAQKWMTLDESKGTFAAICRDIIAKGFLESDGSTYVPGHQIVSFRRIKNGKTSVMGAEGIVMTVSMTESGKELAARVSKAVTDRLSKGDIDVSTTDL